MKIGTKEFHLEQGPFVMGILNMTPDSFSDGGRFQQLDNALFRVEQMVQDGADLIDVGGESTRPGYTPVPIEEEIMRVAPILEGIHTRFDIPISLDTQKADVLRAVVPYVDLINDIWGFRKEEDLARLAAKHQLACCLMHNRSTQIEGDFWNIFLEEIQESVAIAKRYGISANQIILDGGIGFQKSYEQNLITLNRTAEIAALGYPVLVGASRKGTLGKIVNRDKQHLLSATLATTAMAVTQGAHFIRVHDVAENKDIIRVMKSIMEEKIWIESN